MKSSTPPPDSSTGSSAPTTDSGMTSLLLEGSVTSSAPAPDRGTRSSVPSPQSWNFRQFPFDGAAFRISARPETVRPETVGAASPDNYRNGSILAAEN